MFRLREQADRSGRVVLGSGGGIKKKRKGKEELMDVDSSVMTVVGGRG